jgi:hypothetical protein
MVMLIYLEKKYIWIYKLIREEQEERVREKKYAKLAKNEKIDLNIIN